MSKPSITIIAAVNVIDVIGNRGMIPWKNKADMAHFKQTTMGHNVVMGRKTWESMGSKPLPGRTNFVVTRNTYYEAPGAEIITHPGWASRLVGPDEKIFIIGGSEIYNICWEFADELILSQVRNTAEGDTYLDPPRKDRVVLKPIEYWNLDTAEGEDKVRVMRAKLSRKTP